MSAWATNGQNPTVTTASPASPACLPAGARWPTQDLHHPPSPTRADRAPTAPGGVFGALRHPPNPAPTRPGGVPDRQKGGGECTQHHHRPGTDLAALGGGLGLHHPLPDRGVARVSLAEPR